MRLTQAVIAVALVVLCCIFALILVVMHDGQAQQARYENQHAILVPDTGG